MMEVSSTWGESAHQYSVVAESLKEAEEMALDLLKEDEKNGLWCLDDEEAYENEDIEYTCNHDYSFAIETALDKEGNLYEVILKKRG